MPQNGAGHRGTVIPARVPATEDEPRPHDDC